jgi:hypothetical protein
VKKLFPFLFLLSNLCSWSSAQDYNYYWVEETPAVNPDVWNDIIAYYPLADPNPPFDGVVPIGTAVDDSTGVHDAAVGYDDSNLFSVSGKLTDAFLISGIGNVNAPIHADFDTAVFTVNFWIYALPQHSDLFDYYRMIIVKRSATDDAWGLYVRQDTKVDKWFRFYVHTAAGYSQIDWEIPWSGGYYPSSTTWSMITLTFDGSDMKIYENAVEKQSGAGAAIVPHAAAHLSMFNDDSSSSPFFQMDGVMCEVGIWSRVLDPVIELSYLYNSGFGRPYGT